jgi:tetratricopeptide (TPR) repeat protein
MVLVLLSLMTSMKKLILISSLFIIVSCKSVGIIESNDPNIKIKDGYMLLQCGRSIPALRLFNEANEIVKNQNDDSLKAKALVALGDVYKFKDAKSQTTTTYNLANSVANYQAAAKILSDMKYNQRLSIVYWGIAQVYAQEKETQKSCEYINKAAKAYYDPSGGANDQLDKNYIASAIPYFEHSKKQNFKAACGASDHK